MMQWGINQIAGFSAITKRFLGIEDPDLVNLLDRLKQLDNSYAHIENCCRCVLEWTKNFSESLNHVCEDLDKIVQIMPESKEGPLFCAHVKYTQNEYMKYVKFKIEIEAQETLLSEIKEKQHTLEDLKQRINDCNKYCNHYLDMKLQLSHIKDKEELDPLTLQEYERLQTIIHQQKLQLQSDVHFIVEKELSFINKSGDVLQNMIQRSLSHNASLISKPPPNYLLHPDEPFFEGKEDSEIDFVVAARGFHILPLSIKNNREIVWSVDAQGDEIDFRVLFRDEKARETILEPLHRVSTIQGSYIGVGSGMIELLFDNQFSLFRGKKIHVRLGVLDKTDNEELCFVCLTNMEREKIIDFSHYYTPICCRRMLISRSLD